VARALWEPQAGLAAPLQLADPDGNRLTLVPRGADGVCGLGDSRLVITAEARTPCRSMKRSWMPRPTCTTAEVGFGAWMRNSGSATAQKCALF
jgi:hypothetical protein